MILSLGVNIDDIDDIYTKGLLGFKEVGESKEMRKCHFSLLYLSKQQKRKVRKPFSFSLFSFTQSFSHF